MGEEQRQLLSTLLFCRTGDDGTIAPARDGEPVAGLPGPFAVGLTVADRYFLERQLGAGSMGRVFLARDLRLERHVAMKVVTHRRPEAGRLETVLEREAKLGANLHHRGIAAVFDFGFHEDQSYTIFEYVEGETLRRLLERRDRLPLAEARQIALDLAAALDFAHVHGVIHRDLKPENVCLAKSGECKILDLGIARDIRRELETGVYSGTPAYSSPEQAECRASDGKSDQYALGLIVFEMLSGRRPFEDPDPKRLLRMQVEAAPPPLRQLVRELPERAERAVLRALAKRAGDRYATCLEFARDLALEQPDSARRHVLPTPAAQRLGFYVAHVAQESLLARQLARHLEAKRYSCWFYGRDALPGIPFAAQSMEAMERSQAVLLLLSRSALRSADFEREMEHAHKLGCPLLPLLVDVSREEFQKLAPRWYGMLGATSTLEHRRAQPLGDVPERIRRAAEALSIATDPRCEPPRAETTHRCAGQAWATDANQIDIADLDRILYRNETIDDFLHGKHRHFISATKGFGKTLLLTCKRQLLTRSGGEGQGPVSMVPEGRPYLDFMSEMRSLSARYEKPLSDLSSTKRLWNAALRISAVSHHPAVIEPAEAEETEMFPPRLRRWLRGGRVQPTVVFKELTALRVSELNRLIDHSENFLDQKLRQIHGGTYFFIDKVDQAIRHLSRDAWIAIQAGLIEAAWETMSANSHLKIFASIRKEAFTNYESDIKANLFAATTSLNYTEEQLHALLDRLAGCYEGCRSFADFLGLNVVRHGRRPAPEDSFQYVRRHTCGRPRDLVAIASEISAQRSTLNEHRLRELVRQTSSAVVVSNVFDEVRVFLNCLDDREARLRFFAAMPGNILEKSEAIRVCEQFNGLEPGTLRHFGEDSGDIFHPFQDLYFAGLLGVVERDAEQGLSRQRFRRPHDALAHGAGELPQSEFYLLHPALDTYIRGQRTRAPFLQYQHVPVGEDLVWEPHYAILLQIEKQLQRIERPQFVDRVHKLVKRVQSLLASGPTPYARLEVETSEEWRSLCAQDDGGASSDVLLWIIALMEEL